MGYSSVPELIRLSPTEHVFLRSTKKQQVEVAAVKLWQNISKEEHSICHGFVNFRQSANYKIKILYLKLHLFVRLRLIKSNQIPEKNNLGLYKAQHQLHPSTEHPELMILMNPGVFLTQSCQWRRLSIASLTLRLGCST